MATRLARSAVGRSARCPARRVERVFFDAAGECQSLEVMSRLAGGTYNHEENRAHVRNRRCDAPWRS
jgi:hypothetical protein